MTDLLETAEFRARFVAWLDDNDLAPPPGDDSLDAHQAQHLRVLKALYDAGWMRYGWPQSAGGLGGPDILRAIVGEEIVGRGIDHPGPYSMLDVLTPTMIDYARPELAAEMVPRLLSGQESWCQGFSEPGSGSDLASLTTRAEQRGGHLDTTRAPAIGQRHLARTEGHLVAGDGHRLQQGAADHPLRVLVQIGEIVAGIVAHSASSCSAARASSAAAAWAAAVARMRRTTSSSLWKST